MRLYSRMRRTKRRGLFALLLSGVMTIAVSTGAPAGGLPGEVKWTERGEQQDWLPGGRAVSALARSTPKLGELDCVLEGIDDRCETWTAVYDDEEMYDHSLLGMVNESYFADDWAFDMSVSPVGDRIFTLVWSNKVAGILTEARWSLVAHAAATGDELWVRHLDDVVRPDFPASLGVSGDGKRVYVVGTIGVSQRPGDEDPLTNSAVRTVSYDAAFGQLLWDRALTVEPVGDREDDSYDLHSWDVVIAVAASPVGDRVYVTAVSDDRDTFFDILVIAYDGRTGQQDWISRYDTSTPFSPYALDKPLPHLARVSPDGKILYVGGSFPSGDALLAFQAQDPALPAGDGKLLWARQAESELRNPSPGSMAIAPDGSRIYMLESDDVIASYRPGGQRSWIARYDQGGGGAPTWIAASNDKVFVTGSVPGNGEHDYQTVAYDASTGVRLWRTRHDGWPADEAKQDLATSIGVSPDGSRVYVTGTSRRPQNVESPMGDQEIPVDAGSQTVMGNQATIAYDTATGEQVWIALYQQPLVREGMPGWRSFLRVAPDGSVVVASTRVRELDWWTMGFPPRNRMDVGIQAYEP